jgi:hypothetical protein
MEIDEKGTNIGQNSPINMQKWGNYGTPEGVDTKVFSKY